MHPQQPEQHGKKNPEKPTATAPPSVEESVYEEAAYAGKDGPNAADPPTAAGKRGGEGAREAAEARANAEQEATPVSDSLRDLDADEAADIAKTDEEAAETPHDRRQDRRSEDIISLDVPD